MLDRNEHNGMVTRGEIPSGIWYGLALLFGSIPAIEAFLLWSTSPVPLVQDDARQFLFWMQRWSDPG
ncbi:MAG: hypothetical protein MI741_20600, partial [Rhodospirillales bacterium]|nr:hypothetical protein [Rhodospirillales bacterium]